MKDFDKLIFLVMCGTCGVVLAIGLTVSAATIRAYRNRQIPRGRVTAVVIFTTVCFLVPALLLLLLYPRPE